MQRECRSHRPTHNKRSAALSFRAKQPPARSQDAVVLDPMPRFHRVSGYGTEPTPATKRKLLPKG
eukprot:13035357-Alexandrium_andersonii.AAC.1